MRKQGLKVTGFKITSTLKLAKLSTCFSQIWLPSLQKVRRVKWKGVFTGGSKASLFCRYPLRTVAISFYKKKHVTTTTEILYCYIKKKIFLYVPTISFFIPNSHKNVKIQSTKTFIQNYRKIYLPYTHMETFLCLRKSLAL